MWQIYPVRGAVQLKAQANHTQKDNENEQRINNNMTWSTLNNYTVKADFIELSGETKISKLLKCNGFELEIKRNSK